MRAVLQVFSGEVLSKGLYATAILLLIRYLPAHEMAQLTLATAVVGVVASIASSAFNRVYIVGGEDLGTSGTDEAYLAAMFCCCAAMSVGLLPLWPMLRGLYAAVLLLLLGTCLSDFAKTYYQRQLAFFKLSIVELFRSLSFLGGVAVLIWHRSEDLNALAVLLVQAGTMLTIFAAVFWHRVRWQETLTGRPVGRLLAAIFLRRYRWITGYFILVAITSNLTIFMVKAMGTEHELAAMGTAMRYFGLLSLALGAVHTVLLPSIQRVETAAELEHLLGQHQRLVAAFIAAVLCGAYLAGWIMPWIDGGKYPEAIGTFRILAVTAIISFLFSPHINILLKAGDFRFIFWLMALGVPTSAALIGVLISVWRLPGAALGLLLGTGGINAIVYARARRYRLSLASLS